MPRLLIVFLVIILGGSLWQNHLQSIVATHNSQILLEQTKEIEKLKIQLKKEKLKDQSAEGAENTEIARLNSEITLRKEMLKDIQMRMNSIKNSPDEALVTFQSELKREKEIIQDFETQLKGLSQQRFEYEANSKKAVNDSKIVEKSHNVELDIQIKTQQALLRDWNNQLSQAKKQAKFNLNAKDQAEQLTKQIEDERKLIGHLQDERQTLNIQGRNNEGIINLQNQNKMNDVNSTEQQIKFRLSTEKRTAESLAKKIQENRLNDADRKQRAHQLEVDYATQSAQLNELENQLKAHQKHLQVIQQ